MWTNCLGRVFPRKTAGSVSARPPLSPRLEAVAVDLVVKTVVFVEAVKAVKVLDEGVVRVAAVVRRVVLLVVKALEAAVIVVQKVAAEAVFAVIIRGVLVEAVLVPQLRLAVQGRFEEAQTAARLLDVYKRQCRTRSSRSRRSTARCLSPT